eukprot:SM000016S01970  [mRNA]  locus=s16:923352:923672:- [translate_table: standard]
MAVFTRVAPISSPHTAGGDLAAHMAMAHWPLNAHQNEVGDIQNDLQVGLVGLVRDAFYRTTLEVNNIISITTDAQRERDRDTFKNFSLDAVDVKAGGGQCALVDFV